MKAIRKASPPPAMATGCIRASRSISRGRVQPAHQGSIDHRPIGHDLPEIFDFLVGQRDTAIGPVSLHPPGIAVWLAVDHDHAARTAPEGRRVGFVLRVGIGDVQRQVVGTVRIAPVDRISAFRRSFIALKTLVAQRRITELDAGNDAHRPALPVKHREPPCLLLHHHVRRKGQTIAWRGQRLHSG
jgi:hypothetical protein